MQGKQPNIPVGYRNLYRFIQIYTDLYRFIQIYTDTTFIGLKIKEIEKSALLKLDGHFINYFNLLNWWLEPIACSF